MDSDPLYYLAPDFEPGNLTVAELASVLTANDVPVPQTKAKKATYVELFQKHITGKRSQLLKQYKLAGSIKPSRRGIVAVAADGTERELGSSDEEEAHDTRSRSGRNRPTKNRRSSSVPAPEPQLSTRPTRARNQSPERLLARIHPDAEEAPPTRSGRNTRKKKADEQPRSQVNDFQSDGENSPPAKGNSRGRKEAVKTSPKPQRVAAAETPAPDTPRRRVQLRRMMSPSAGATDSERVPPPTVFTPKSKSTAQYDMATWVSKTVDVSDSVDDVYGTGPQALRALKNIPYEKDLQCQFHIPAVTRASQLIGIRLLDEKIFDEVLKRVAEAPNRLRLRDAVESWLAAHGITFGDKKLGSSMTPKHAAGGKSTAQFDFASWTQKDITMTETVDNIWGTGPATLKELKALPADYEFVGFYFCPAITTAGQLLGLRLLGKDEFAKVMDLTHPSFIAPNKARLTAAIEGWLENHGVTLDDKEIEAKPRAMTASLEAPATRTEAIDLLRRLSRQSTRDSNGAASPTSPLRAAAQGGQQTSPSRLGETRKLHRNLLRGPAVQSKTMEASPPRVPPMTAPVDSDVPPPADVEEIDASAGSDAATMPSDLDASITAWVMPAAAESAPSETARQAIEDALQTLPAPKKRSKTYMPLIAAVLAGSGAYGAVTTLEGNSAVAQSVQSHASAVSAMVRAQAEAGMAMLPSMPAGVEWDKLPGVEYAAELGNRYVAPAVDSVWQAIAPTMESAWQAVADSGLYEKVADAMPAGSVDPAISATLAASILAFLARSRGKKTKPAASAVARAIAVALRQANGGLDVAELKLALAKQAPDGVAPFTEAEWDAIRTIAVEELGVVVQYEPEIWSVAAQAEPIMPESPKRGGVVLSKKQLWEKRAEADRVADPKARAAALAALEVTEESDI